MGMGTSSIEFIVSPNNLKKGGIMKRIILFAAAALLSTTIAFAGNHANGEKIYNKACLACHMQGVAGAPKVHDVDAWQKRFSLAMETVKKQNPNADAKTLKTKVMALLVQTAQKGKGAMPPGAMCPNCSAKDYQAAIAFMMSKKK